MSFDWHSYLDLAHTLLGIPGPRPRPEAYWRTRVSRAYYAAYGTARTVAQTKDAYIYNPTGGMGRHEDLILHYRYAPDRFRQRIGMNLAALRRYRVEADYVAGAAVYATSRPPVE